MLKTALAALCAAAALATGTAAAQSASPTLARIKAAKAVNVAYSPDSAPFSSASGSARHQAIRSTCGAWSPSWRAVGGGPEDPWLPVRWPSGCNGGRRAGQFIAPTPQTQTRLASVDST